MLIRQRIVQLCYRLEDSTRYRRLKTAVYDLLENPHARVRPFFDVGLMLLVLLSVSVLLYEVKHDLGAWGLAVEVIAVTVFVIEYLLRGWVYNDTHRVIIEHHERAELINEPFRLGPALWEVVRYKWQYMTSPLAIIDLLAIIPSYRPLRFLRIFLLFRLFKLFRYARSINQFARVLQEKRIELYTLFGLLAFILLVAASAIYLFEQPRYGGEVFSFLDGVYWALVTLSTVGYGDITPHTTEGRVVALAVIISGVGVLAFFTSIIVSAFSEKLPELKEQRVFAELERRPGHTVICGFGRIGESVAAHLAADRERLVVVDKNPERVAQAKRVGHLAIEGSADRVDLLRQLGVGQGASRILCLTGDDVVNVYTTLTARQASRDIEIISRASRAEAVRKLKQAGANHAVLPFEVAGLMAGEYVGQPVAFEAIEGVITGQADISLDTIVVPAHSRFAERPLRELPLEELRLILFGVITQPQRVSRAVRLHYDLGLRRFHFNPGSDFTLCGNDILVLFGHRLSLGRFKERIEAMS